MSLSKLLLTITLTLSLISQIHSAELIVHGIYRGANLYIQNPHDGEGNYCISEIYLNGTSLNNVPTSTAFNLDLSQFEEGEALEIRIVHGDFCAPKIINPNAILPREEFKFLSIQKHGEEVSWIAQGEKKYGKYFIMKYEHNNWQVERAVSCKGEQGMQEYSVSVRQHSGVNRYKIKYLEVTGKIIHSPEIEFESGIEKASFYPKRVSSILNFTREVKYEIMDIYGKVLKSGIASRVDCGDLESGTYYVSYDNMTNRFLKK
ncbi:hypothetical protein AAG747_24790 [Rapidithrix thailandica]|uniref:Secretion system C-terminal sorting domain-containing protein n=1 Tax=Rapidithrix thailandica TaxID=413964 RepID=A0AAW9SIT1_9BACT